MKAPRLAGHTLAKAGFFSVVFCSGLATLHAQPNRIRARVDGSLRMIMAGHVHPEAITANERGRLDAAAQISNVNLSFAPTAEQQADLEALLVRQQTPGSPGYHRWLTPEQYAERFGISESDLAAISSWLQDQGLTIAHEARSRTSVSVSGPAGRIE